MRFNTITFCQIFSLFIFVVILISCSKSDTDLSADELDSIYPVYRVNISKDFTNVNASFYCEKPGLNNQIRLSAGSIEFEDEILIGNETQGLTRGNRNFSTDIGEEIQEGTFTFTRSDDMVFSNTMPFIGTMDFSDTIDVSLGEIVALAWQGDPLMEHESLEVSGLFVKDTLFQNENLTSIDIQINDALSAADSILLANIDFKATIKLKRISDGFTENNPNGSDEGGEFTLTYTSSQNIRIQ